MQKIQEYRVNLDQVQQKLEGDPFSTGYMQQSNHWTEMLIHAVEEEEKILMQRDKINWLKIGDGNNVFFSCHCEGGE